MKELLLSTMWKIPCFATKISTLPQELSLVSDKLIDMASVHLKRNLTDDLDDAVIDGKPLDIDKERDLERESGLSYCISCDWINNLSYIVES